METSFTQEYFLCALNPKGTSRLVNGEDGAAVLFASGVIELQLAGVIGLDDKKKVQVLQDLPAEKTYLDPIFSYLKKHKPKTIEDIGEDFHFDDRLATALFNSIGDAVVSLDLATAKTNQGLFKNKTYFLPKETAVVHIVEKIRRELLKDGVLSDDVVILTALLDKSSLLKKYFSKYEQQLIKERLKAIRKTESYQLITKMLDNIDLWLVLMVTSWM